MRTWFITGCSTGLGRALAKAVLANGWNAVVTARDPQSIADIVVGHAGSALTTKLDVTDGAQVAEAVRQAEVRFGGIDVLVNNAGYGYRGAVEEASETESVPCSIRTSSVWLRRRKRFCPACAHAAAATSSTFHLSADAWQRPVPASILQPSSLSRACPTRCAKSSSRWASA